MSQEILLKPQTQKLIARIVKDFDKIKEKHFPFKNKEEYSAGFDSVLGYVWWNNPHLVWILIMNMEEGYEGSQTQIGVDREGKLRWEYQSHCSCNSYEDTIELPEHFHEEDLKSFDFTYTQLPEDWEAAMINNMKLLLRK